jgi:hypothetical protein
MKFFSIDLISIPEQVARRRVFGEGFDNLLSGLGRSWVSSDIEMNDPTPVVQQNEKTVQDAECRCRDGEEIDRDHCAKVIVEKSFPSR